VSTLTIEETITERIYRTFDQRRKQGEHIVPCKDMWESVRGEKLIDDPFYTAYRSILTYLTKERVIIIHRDEDEKPMGFELARREKAEKQPCRATAQSEL
jgi:hypothetical protein